jgi:hypothetical protein
MGTPVPYLKKYSTSTITWDLSPCPCVLYSTLDNEVPRIDLDWFLGGTTREQRSSIPRRDRF